MIVAIRKSNHEKVFAFEEKLKGEEYYCPCCKLPVIHHNSTARLREPHFKHKSKETLCPNATKESQWHYDTKISIYNYLKQNYSSNFRELELEKSLFNGSQRADVFLKTIKGNNIAIEVQASILTVDEIKRRTSLYFKNSTYVLWLLKYNLSKFICNTIVTPYGKPIRNVTKLNAMELWLHEAYLGRLYFWNPTRPSFIWVELADVFSEDSSFYSDGEEQYFYGKKLKTKKEIMRDKIGVDFREFRIGQFGEINNSNIPNRKIFFVCR